MFDVYQLAGEHGYYRRLTPTSCGSSTALNVACSNILVHAFQGEVGRPHLLHTIRGQLNNTYAIPDDVTHTSGRLLIVYFLVESGVVRADTLEHTSTDDAVSWWSDQCLPPHTSREDLLKIVKAFTFKKFRPATLAYLRQVQETYTNRDGRFVLQDIVACAETAIAMGCRALENILVNTDQDVLETPVARTVVRGTNQVESTGRVRPRVDETEGHVRVVRRRGTAPGLFHTDEDQENHHRENVLREAILGHFNVMLSTIETSREAILRLLGDE
jgi:hypothetical protein